jgi:signal transduction histidine kinase
MKQMETILDIGRQITAGASMDDLLNRIVAAASALTETEAADILLLDERENQLRFVAATQKDQQLNILVPIEFSIAGAAFTSGEAVIVSDVSNDPRYYSKVEETIHNEARSLLAVPLQYKECKIGALEIENKCDDSPFDQCDVDILTLLATQATVAIENVRLYQAAQRELAERIRAEAELRRHRDHLNELVKERTDNLATALSEAKRLNQLLQEGIAERERLIGDLEAFSNTVAHDIKGLLGTIMGYSELIARNAEQAALPRLSEWGGELVNAVVNVGKIVDALSLLAKVRQQDVDISTLDMGKIVSEVEKRLANRIACSKAEITAPVSWPPAVGHAPWIEEVWINYISNAIQYGGNPPRIELGAQPTTNPQTGAAEVRYWVRDNGKGLTPESQSRLFIEFERLGKIGKSGHGLGLSIVKRIVTKLRGRVGVQSAPDQGSTFFFTLPSPG